MPTLPNNVVEKILSVLSVPEVEILADSMVRAHGRTIERKTEQSVEIVFNEKGFLRKVRCSDDLFIPKMYSAE